MAIEKAKKTATEPTGMQKDRINGRPTEGTEATPATQATVATQATGDEQGDSNTNRTLQFEPKPTPAKNEGVTEQAALARMQGAVNTDGTGVEAPGTVATGQAAVIGKAQPAVLGTGNGTTTGTGGAPTVIGKQVNAPAVLGQQGNASQNGTGTQGNNGQQGTTTTAGTVHTVTADDLARQEVLDGMTPEQKADYQNTKAAAQSFREYNAAANDPFKQIQDAYQKDPEGTMRALGIQPNTEKTPLDNMSASEQKKFNDSAASMAKYKADWSNGFTKDALRGSKLSIAEAIHSYENYRKDHPEAPELNWYDYYALQDNDPNKSLSDNEKSKKEAENQEKWDKINNALFSFVDFYNSAKGAPAPDNQETVEQLTKRQQERRDRVKTIRDKDWQTLQALWKQQQSDNIAKRKLANDEAKAQADQDYKRQLLDIKINEAKSKGDVQALQSQLTEAKIEAQRAKTDADKKLWDLKAKQIEANIKYTNERSRGGSSGGRGSGKPTYDTSVTKTEHVNNDGSKTTTTNTVHTPMGSSGKKGSNSGSKVQRKENGKKKIG